jgi:hypothetical protein
MVLSAYFSHPIRGKAGPDATALEIDENCLHCSSIAHQIEAETGVKLYIPADHDEAIGLALKHGHISERGVLEADCRILAKRDFVLAYARDGYISRGMRVEIEHAISILIPVIVITHWNPGFPKLGKLAPFLSQWRAFPTYKIHPVCTLEGCGGEALKNFRFVAHNYLTEIK